MIFTFGFHQRCGCGRFLSNCYTELPDVGTMLRLWGQTWSREYPDAEAAGVERWDLLRVTTDETNPACRCGGTAQPFADASAGERRSDVR